MIMDAIARTHHEDRQAGFVLTTPGLLGSVILVASIAREQPYRDKATLCFKEIEDTVLVEIVRVFLSGNNLGDSAQTRT